jgi:hypothetical protein
MNGTLAVLALLLVALSALPALSQPQTAEEYPAGAPA